MKKAVSSFIWAALITALLLPDLAALGGEEQPDSLPPLTISGMEQVIIIDRLIADRAYVNIKAGRSADHGIDFAVLDQALEQYRPRLQELDSAYYVVLCETYERMKGYVNNPQSDFVRAIQKPGSVEFQGRSPLPAAAFAGAASRMPKGRSSGLLPRDRKQSPPRFEELEPYLSEKAKMTLSSIRKMPQATASERRAKLTRIAEEIAAPGENPDRLEAAVMLRILCDMQAELETVSTRLGIDAADLPEGITREMFDKMYVPPAAAPAEPAAGQSRSFAPPAIRSGWWNSGNGYARMC